MFKKFFGGLLLVLGLGSVLKQENIKDFVPFDIEPITVLTDLSLGSKASDYFGNPNVPRGVRNNNAGNLVITPINWQGKILANTDGHFEQFKTPEMGLRAMMMDINTDYQRGANTVTKIITQFAPDHENDTSSYIQAVASRIGKSVSENIYLNDKENLVNFAKAIVIHENGKGREFEAWYSHDQYLDAVNMINRKLT